MKKKHQFALGASVLALSVLTGVKAQALSVTSIAQAVTPVANEYGLYPSVMIAQGILESSHGQSGLANNYNNIFGVKYTSGNPVYLPTQEYINGQMQTVVEPFQAYGSLYESCIAHAQLLRGSKLYAGAWRENTSSYRDATAWLEGRYATDPDYASKLNYLIAELGLTAYDNGGIPSSTLTSATTSSSGQSYKVQSGDSLSAIAAKYGVSVSSLVSINGLTDSNSLQVGQVLKISGSSTVTSTSSQTTTSSSAGTYTVKSGDSLSSIASQYGMTISQLMSANSISDADVIHIGERLSVSTASPATQTTTSSSSTTSSTQNSRYAHTVISGESLYSIATANGMSAERLAEINGIGTNETILPGQTIMI
ncbi:MULTISPECIES: LysM peptidoglycan-binding domain-containing protein [unclassified Lactococcus]|uniref:LysM peptidoglycan-binding domain-containing protein n=1 Tax=unclassified Lactococcus TaxID=2643510 RepID=UPI0011CC9630|nr:MULTISPECIES: LysM peptidoglycan-binding domain-containing protein [unclassified Lactococcus]MQW22086.1 LysM peptidoglycan-binding domain-containing protein [Lactococcus sp. dk101]TXK45028.1 LysM peptidoglycan-binding domain-containing protein [Lactococcus sp. dk310]TXK51191.1 LysM peptidoglycan-binding domain-containing protein [Lactococcus sp. dk322]